MKLWNVPLAAFAAMTVLANDVTVEWTSGETASSLSNGVVALTYDAGGLVTNLTATVAKGDTVTIAGDTLVIEEALPGRELSLMVITDTKPLPRRSTTAARPSVRPTALRSCSRGTISTNTNLS